MAIDLGRLTLKELKELQTQLSKAIVSFEENKRKEALTELEELARIRGFSLSELTGTSATRKRTPATAKYANPADTSQTWSGRGRKPFWFAAALASGQQADDLAI